MYDLPDSILKALMQNTSRKDSIVADIVNIGEYTRLTANRTGTREAKITRFD